MTLHPEVLEIIARCIESAVALDLLLLLRRSPDTFWAPAAVADQLGIPVETAASIAGRLCASGLLSRASGSSAYRFAPRNTVDGARVDRLQAACEQSRASVLDAIRSRAPKSQPDGDDVRA